MNKSEFTRQELINIRSGLHKVIEYTDVDPEVKSLLEPITQKIAQILVRNPVLEYGDRLINSIIHFRMENPKNLSTSHTLTYGQFKSVEEWVVSHKKWDLEVVDGKFKLTLPL